MHGCRETSNYLGAHISSDIHTYPLILDTQNYFIQFLMCGYMRVYQ